MLTINLKVQDTHAQLESKILNAFRAHLNSVFHRSVTSIRRRIGDVCDSLIAGTDTYQSIVNDGQLLGELGLPDAGGRLTRILETIRQGIQVTAIPVSIYGKKLRGGIVFKLLRADYLDILGLPEAQYVTEKGSVIPWLEWLLTMGDSIIVVGYDVDINLTPSEKLRSRTGLALMEKGDGWRLPQAWGPYLPDDNFLTRAFNVSEAERILTDIIEQEITSRL